MPFKDINESLLDTLMKFGLFMITMIFCSDNFLFSKYNFFIVTDRKIKGLEVKNGIATNFLLYEDCTGCFRSNHLWNNYLPKPLMYKFNTEKILNLVTLVSSKINGIANNNEILFTFTLKYDLKNMIFSDFADSSNISIPNAQFVNEERLKNIFILSREAKNVNSLTASYNYYIYTEKITLLYREVLFNLFRYIKNIDDLTENLQDIKDENLIAANEAKRSLIIIFTTILQSLSSIRILTFYQFSEIPKVEEFESLFKQVVESLENVVEIFLKKKKGNESDIVLTKTEAVDYIKDFFIQDNSRLQCIKTYKELHADREIIVDFVDIFRKNVRLNEDLEILSDCSITKVDEFLKAHSDLLLFYCKNIRDCDFNRFFTLYFARKSFEFDLSIKELEDLYIDRLIAGRLYCLIGSYKLDKTEFLIFTQTDYFKHVLSKRIIKNLKLLYKVNSDYNSHKKITERLSFEQMLIKLEHVGKALQYWNSVLKKDETGEVKSFEQLLNEEKFLLTDLENMKVEKPENSLPN